MDLQPVGDLAVDGVEELEELGVAVPRQALADHRAGQHVQGGEQRRGAVALVVMGHRARPSGHHRQRRLGAVQGLDLGLLVHAQHDRLLRRVQIQTDHVDELVVELRIVGHLERLDPMRRQTQIRPNPLHRSRTDSHLLGHRPARPVRGTRRCGRGGQPHDLGDRLLGDRRFAAPTSRIFSSPANPSSPNRVRHARTVTGVTPTSSAITALATPSAAINNTRACNTCRCGADCARANLSNVSRSPSDNGNAAAGALITPEYRTTR